MDFKFLAAAVFLCVGFSATASDQAYFGTKQGSNILGLPKPPSLEDAGPATPVPTPTPQAERPSATAAEPGVPPPARSVVDWQKKAVQDFPALADPKSEFNHQFIQQVNELKSSNPAYFRDPQWPYLLAQSVHDASNPIIPGISVNPLEGQPVTTATPTPTPTPEPTATPVAKPAELKPFDQLDKENVRIECKVNTGAKINSRHNDGEGFSTVDKTVTKELVLTVTQTGRTKVPVTAEAFFVLAGADGERIVPAGSKKFETGEGTETFTNSTRGVRTVVNYDTPLVSTEGKKITGWLARAVSADGRTLGVVASSEKSLAIAKHPKVLAAELAKNKTE